MNNATFADNIQSVGWTPQDLQKHHSGAVQCSAVDLMPFLMQIGSFDTLLPCLTGNKKHVIGVTDRFVQSASKVGLKKPSLSKCLQFGCT